MNAANKTRIAVVAGDGTGPEVTAEAIKVGESVGPWISHQVNHPDEVMLWLQEQPFYDRIAPYLAGELQPAPWSEAAVAAATVSTMRLVP